jgi:hypothetical protein
MSLAFRYTEGFSNKVLKVKVTEISPSKKEKVEIYSLALPFLKVVLRVWLYLS